MRETEVQTNENGTMRVILDAQMSKMSPEQRVAMASLNIEAKKLIADRLKWDEIEADKVKEEQDMDMEVRATEEQSKLKVSTAFKEAYGEDIDVPTTVPEAVNPTEEKCLPDPLAPGIERAHKQGGPDGADFKAACEAMVGEDSKIMDHLVAVVQKNQGLTHSLRYTQDTLAVEFARIFKDEIMALRNAGQKEYAHDNSSPFANFERGAKDNGIDRKQVLWIYAMKHKDGIAAAIRGHTSQREDVRGRINDLIVYLLLLRGIYNEELGNTGNFGLGALTDEEG